MNTLRRLTQPRTRIVKRDLVHLLLQIRAEAVERRRAGVDLLLLLRLRQLRPPVRNEADHALAVEQCGLDIVALTASSRPGDLDELPTKEWRSEQAQNLSGWAAWPAVGFACGLTDVELPDTLTVLHAATKADHGAREAPVLRVVVRRGEGPGTVEVDCSHRLEIVAPPERLGH